MKSLVLLSCCFGTLAFGLAAQPLEKKPGGAYFEKFQPRQAPPISGLYLKAGDRLAICGDSITEQKMYSRVIETYLTVCAPELGVTVRQYGWSGETASGFLARMTNDCLRFKPTIATTCYGMNDHGYRPYEESIGKNYREKSVAIVESFKANNVRVVQGSPGCVGKRPNWSKDTNATVEALNLNLCTLRNIGLEIADKEHVRFADVFWPMLTAGHAGQEKYSADYAIAGKDGVHPGWAGHLVMAYAFLKSFGLDGEIGTFTIDLNSNRMKVSKGHELLSVQDGEFQIKSSRYPFCATNNDVANDGTIRSAMTLIPFNQELNRLTLVAQNASAKNYKVTWGNTTKTYSAAQLTQGVNLAEDFLINPFSDAFSKVDNAVKAKQQYETKQIKQLFHELVSGKYKSADDIKDGETKRLFALRAPDGTLDREEIAAETEKTRLGFAEAIRTAFVPVTHTIRVTAE